MSVAAQLDSVTLERMSDFQRLEALLILRYCTGITCVEGDAVTAY